MPQRGRTVRIATWNLNHGKGSAVWPCLQTSLCADILLLQETRRPDWAGALAWENLPHHDRGSAVLSTRGTLHSESFAGYEGWVAGGELVDSGFNDPDRPLFVFSVHSPSSNATCQRRSYVEEVVSILSLIEQRVPKQADLIIGGDFNFLSLGNRKESEGIRTTVEEADALRRFQGLQLVSCWVAAHPGRALPQTLRWTGDKSPDRCTPYHCDGIFIPSGWQTGLVCEVLSSACFEVSDHYPVVAWIQRERGSRITSR
jgi:exonuclease III